jgi:hypothetical protein
MRIKCDWCGEEFDRKPSRVKERNYCSRACLGRANAERFRQQRAIVCDYCGREFEYLGHHTGRNQHFFCSKQCSDNFKSKQVEVTCDLCGKQFMKKQSDIARSSHNFCSLECSKTFTFMMNDNKRGLHYGRKPLYRILMEEKLGRELTADEEVHHVDGNHFNNALENLVVLSKSEHARIHAAWKERNEVGQFEGGGDAR